MKWCEHIIWKHNSAIHIDAWFHSDHNTMINQSWKFCPICGTPRPESKSLAEKLLSHLNDPKAVCGNWKELAEELSKIATAHFKEIGV